MTTAGRLLGRGVSALVLLGVLAVFGVLLGLADRGLDITDEGYYIQNILRPDDVKIAPVDFGRYFRIFGSDIVDVRRGAILAQGLVAALLAWAVLRVVALGAPRPRAPERAALMGVAALAGVSGVTQWWLLTPSYNSLAFIGAVVMVTGAVLFAGGGAFRKPRPGLLAAGLVGFGAALAFAGKPHTAAVIGVLTLPFAVAVVGLRRALLPGALASMTFAALLLAHSIVLDGGPSAYAQRLRDAMELALLMGGGHGANAVLGNLWLGLSTLGTRMTWTPFVVLAPTLIGLVVALAVTARLWPRTRGVGAVILALGVALAMGFAFVAWLVWYRSVLVLYLGHWVLEMVVLLGIVALVAWGLDNLPGGARAMPGPAIHPRRRQAIVAVYLAAVGFLLPLGTGIEWSAALGGGYVFLLLALFLLLRVGVPDAPHVLSMAAVALAVLPVPYTALESYRAPYRLIGTVGEQTDPLPFLGNPTVMRVDPATAHWGQGLQALALAGGWTPGTPLIDMTGATPAAAAVLGGRAPVVAWLVGGYPGSVDLFVTALGHAAPELLDAAWVLTAPDGERAIPEAAMRAAGLNFPDAYEPLGEVVTGWRNEAQILWRPRGGGTG